MMFIFLILLIIAALYYYQQHTLYGLERSRVTSRSYDHSMEILRQRYANGEISEQEFFECKRILESH